MQNERAWTPLRILIVDGHEATRREISALLAGRADLSVCGEAGDGVEATEQARQLRPDLILMDMSVPRTGGLEAIRKILPELPQCEFIVVSQNDPALVREQAASVGVKSFIAKSDLPRELLPAIERICFARGKRCNGPSGAAKWVRSCAPPTGPRRPLVQSNHGPRRSG